MQNHSPNPLIMAALIPLSDRRLFLLLVSIGVCFDLRITAVQHGTGSDIIDRIYFFHVMNGSLALSTARALILSGSMLPLLHSLPPVLPFMLEVPIQAIYLIATIR